MFVDQIPTIIEYLKKPLKVKQLKHIIKLLDLNAFDIVRTTEKDYKDNNLEALSNDEQKLLEAIEQFPKIMQRPIIIHGKKDNVINIDLGKKVFNSAPNPKQSLFIDNASHNNLYEFNIFKKILNFISQY